MSHSQSRVWNIAHRGARSLAPENTLAAAGKAYESGADCWETDIAVTKDEVLVLFHDDHPGRTTNAAELFPHRSNDRSTEYTFAEFRQLNAGSFFEQSDPFGTIRSGEVTAADCLVYRQERIPSLVEALQLTAELDWCINLELKYLPEPRQHFPVVDRVLETLKHTGFNLENLIISSFNHRWLRQIQSIKPEIQVQALIGYSFSDPLQWGKYEFSTYNARSTLISLEQIQMAHRHGVQVNLFTVNDPDEMQYFIEAGVSGLITDFPQRLTKILSR